MKVVFWDIVLEKDVTVLDAEEKAVCAWKSCNARAIIQMRIASAIPTHLCRVHADEILSKMTFIGVLP